MNKSADEALKDILPQDCYEGCKEGMTELFECEAWQIYQFVEGFPSIELVHKHLDGFLEDDKDIESYIYQDATFEGCLVVI